MKKIVLFLVLSVSLIKAQSFEGVITYTNVLTSKTPRMTNEQLTAMLGSRIDYFYKNGIYKSTTNGSASQWQLYVPKENRVYTKTAGSENLYWSDAAVNSDEVLSSSVKKNALKILEYNCDALILNCRSGTQTYYYNKELAIDANLFKNHHYGNWYAFLKQSGALALKTVIETPQFRLESTASSIKKKKLDDTLFALPANKRAVKGS